MVKATIRQWYYGWYPVDIMDVEITEYPRQTGLDRAIPKWSGINEEFVFGRKKQKV